MATRFTTTTAIDPILQGLFNERTQDRSFFAGLKAAPGIGVDGLSGQFIKADSRPNLNLDETDTAYGDLYLNALPLDAEALPTARTFTTGSVDLDRFALKSFLADRIEKHYRASGGFSVRDSIIRDLAEKTLGVHDYKVGAHYNADASYGTTSDPGDYNTKSVALVDPVLVACRTVENEIGRRPNAMVTTVEVVHELMTNDDVTKRSVVNGGTDGTFATEAQFAAFVREMFGLELIVFRSTYEAAAGTRSYSMGSHIGIVYLSDVPGEPSFVNTFYEQQEGFNTETIASMYEYRVDDPRGTMITADIAYKVSNAAGTAEAGYKLKDVLS